MHVARVSGLVSRGPRTKNLQFCLTHCFTVCWSLSLIRLWFRLCFFKFVCCKELLVMCSTRALMWKTLCYSLLADFSPFTDDRQSTTRFAAFPFYPVTEVMKTVNFNKEGSRFRTTPASSDLNDWLLLIVAGLNWLHGVGLGARDPPVYYGPLSKVQGEALGLLAGEVSQFFHQCGELWSK